MAAETAMDEGAETFIRAADGLSLFARDYAPAAPAAGLPVFCLHGLTRNSRDFERVAPRIAALGRRVVAMDARGRGRSARDPDATHYAIANYMQDALTVLDALDIPRAVFLGASMGGIITMAIGAAAPARVAAAILNDIGPIIHATGYMRILTYVGKNMEFASAEAAAAALKDLQGVNYPNRSDEFWSGFVRRTCRPLEGGRWALDYDPAIAQAFEGVTGPPDLTPLFDTLVATPMLVIRGALSELLTADGVAEMRTIHPDLETAEAPDVGHTPTLEEEAAWLAIVDFLAKVD